MKWFVICKTPGTQSNKPYANLIRAIDAYDRAIESGMYTYVAVMEVGAVEPFAQWGDNAK